MKFLPALLAFFLFGTSCRTLAQQNAFVKHSYAFSAVRMPGTLPVDENGKEIYYGPDTTYTVFIETSGEKPVWGNAWYRGRMYTLSPVQVRQKPIEVGVTKENNRKIVLPVTKGNLLWQLELMPAEGSARGKMDAPGKVIIEGTRHKKRFIIKVATPIELAMPDAV